SLTDEIAVAFLAAIADELAPTGLALTLLSAAERDGFVPARDVALDGALVYSCDPNSTAVGWLIRRRLPLVFVDQAPAPGIPSVNVDDRPGAAAAARHLVELGHRRVGIVTTGFAGEYGVLADPLRTTLANTERQRLTGWLDGLSAPGVKPLVVRTPHRPPYDAGLQAAELLLDHDDRPTGVVCFSDAVAQGALAAFENAGLRVPADVSLVGFDDSPLAQRIPPALTTVQHAGH